MGQRLRRVSRYGPRLALRLAAHRAAQAAARAAFRVALARGGERLHFLPAPGATRIDFVPSSARLRLALARVAQLVYGGAHPVASDAWVDLETGAVFCPVWPKGESHGAPAARVLRASPTADLCSVISCPPFAGDRKIPQDVGRLNDLWFLVAADAAPPAGAAPVTARTRQARFQAYLSAFFASVGSPSHAFWSCPMDTGIGAINLLFASEHFIALDPGSPEAAELRRLRDRVCALALRYITLLDERTPVLNNNHHLLNRISTALLAGLSDRPERFAPLLEALDGELGNHFDADGVLREGSTSYHAFVHSALRFAADVLGAYLPDDSAVSSFRDKIDRLIDARRHFAAGGELLLLGDADGAVYGPDVALELGVAAGYERIAVVRRQLGAPGAPRAHRTASVVAVIGRAEEIAPIEAAASAGVTTRSHRRRGWTWVTTRLRPASPPRATTWQVDHLEGFGALVITAGDLRVVVRTRPHTGASALGHFHLDLGAVYIGCAEGWLRADPGVVTYTGDEALRATLRAAKAHPTVIPDERQFIRPTGLFSAESIPVCERIDCAPGRVTVLHALLGDSYYVRVSAAANGAVIVRQGTSSPRHNLPFSLGATSSNYGYRA